MDYLHTQGLQKIRTMIDTMKKEGYVDYVSSNKDGQRMRVNFCGITAYFMNEHEIHLRSHNLDITVTEDGVTFNKGDRFVLDLWLSRLSTFGPARLAPRAAIADKATNTSVHAA